MSDIAVPFGLSVAPQTLYASGSIVVPTATNTSSGVLSPADRQKVTDLVDARSDAAVTGRKNFSNGLSIQNTDFKDAFSFRQTPTGVFLDVLSSSIVALPVASSQGAGIVDSATFNKIQSAGTVVYARSPLSGVRMALSSDVSLAVRNTEIRVDFLSIRKTDLVIDIYIDAFLMTSDAWPPGSNVNTVILAFNVPTSILSSTMDISCVSTSVVGAVADFLPTRIFVNPTDTTAVYGALSSNIMDGNFVIQLRFTTGQVLGPRRITTNVTVPV